MLVHIKQDTEFQMDGRTLVIDRLRRSVGKIVASDKCTGEEFDLSMATVLKKYESGALQFKKIEVDQEADEGTKTSRKLVLMEPQERKLIERRKGYIDAITDSNGHAIKGNLAQKKAINEHARATNDIQNAPSALTVRRWRSRLKANGGDVLCLLKKQGKKSRSTINDEGNKRLKELFDACLSKFYLTKKRNPMKKVEAEMKKRAKEDDYYTDIELPHLSTMYRWMNDIPEYEKHKLQKGYLDANRAYPSGHKKPQPTYLMEQVELDHTMMDILVVDAETGEEIGRPWLTVLICRASRMILGFHIAMHAPNINSVVLAFRHAVLSKDYVKESYGDCVKSEWPCFGVMDQIITDNGAELHANHVQHVLGNFVDIQYNRKGEPQGKGIVERFFRTMSEGFLHGLDGTTFSNYVKKGDYNSSEEACLTFEDLVKVFHIWVIDEYHNQFHKGIKNSPLQYWKENLQTSAIRLINDVTLIDQLLWKRYTRKIQKYGIDLFGEKYQSPELMDIAKKIGMHQEVDVLADESDIGIIRVVLPGTDMTIDVPCKDARYVETRLSLKEHNKVKDLLKQENQAFKEASELAKLEARERIEGIEKKAKNNRKKALRQAAAKRNQASSTDVTATSPKPISAQSTAKKKVVVKAGLFKSSNLLEVA